MNFYNLQIKSGVDVKELSKYGFYPKYDTYTGEIIEYVKSIKINNHKEKHFTFKVHREYKTRLFKRIEVTGWMSGFDWDSLVYPECMKMLYELFINGIVEPIEEIKGGE